ncbi:hypothetical protein FK256_11780 [Actinomyces johnsonii]|jgi:hypothetical protein avisC_06864|uniref:Uncharacterized protein n=2 Tax=Actinomyces johnsonii TaxID=544581 RepID=U1RR29_9ACTO|nr:hypothetical protein [Actinomyces johnsonii]ERH20882.1 hypothetical protein HMPREF1549_00975 [Actinomyces johnsonii F0510]KAA8737346.1 hypothetical protein F4W10_12135 [Actinomyces johnsonii]TQD41912.1 hypothetical protein FK256_11780 [Actinomyces johnsonii]
MVGFRKKSQDSSPGARAAGRGGAGASQRSRGSRTEPASRAGKGRRTAARRGYKTPEQMDSRCLTLAESASGVLGRSLDQALGRLPDGPGASGGQGGSASMGWADAVGASNPAMSQGASPGSVRSAQTGAGQVDTVADIAADIEF